LEIVEAVAAEFKLVERGGFLEATAATLASAHEEVELLAEIGDGIGGGFEFGAHGDGFFGADLGAAAAEGAASAEVFEDAEFLADVEDQDFAGGTVAGAPAATDALGGIEDGAAAEIGRGGLGIGGVREGDPTGVEADARFAEFAERKEHGEWEFGVSIG
jgi:hypothetical protein